MDLYIVGIYQKKHERVSVFSIFRHKVSQSSYQGRTEPFDMFNSEWVVFSCCYHFDSYLFTECDKEFGS